jgi:hypothetical protein
MGGKKINMWVFQSSNQYDEILELVTVTAKRICWQQCLDAFTPHSCHPDSLSLTIASSFSSTSALKNKIFETLRQLASLYVLCQYIGLKGLAVLRDSTRLKCDDA